MECRQCCSLLPPTDPRGPRDGGLLLACARRKKVRQSDRQYDNRGSKKHDWPWSSLRFFSYMCACRPCHTTPDCLRREHSPLQHEDTNDVSVDQFRGQVVRTLLLAVWTHHRHDAQASCHMPRGSATAEFRSLLPHCTHHLSVFLLPARDC